MQFEEREEGGVLIVKPLDTRLDSTEASGFKDQLHNHIDGGKRKIVLDMEKVEFVDSSGLGAIIACRKKMGTDGELVISSASEAVVGLFQLTRMDRVFRLFPNSEEARGAIG
jgi:anti-sigma B factor antagonist